MIEGRGRGGREVEREGKRKREGGGDGLLGRRGD
jgi:hypothetical protein